ncbi:MAG: LuxR C-terminal-related transcriptional regulator [Candidatus Bathyarchaeia archaeon]
MNLTERERTILQLTQQGLSDYRIARKINTDPPSVTRSRKNAQRKLLNATADIEWATRIGVNTYSSILATPLGSDCSYSFFL